jgi:hypothetical protein
MMRGSIGFLLCIATSFWLTKGQTPCAFQYETALALPDSATYANGSKVVAITNYFASFVNTDLDTGISYAYLYQKIDDTTWDYITQYNGTETGIGNVALTDSLWIITLHNTSFVYYVHNGITWEFVEVVDVSNLTSITVPMTVSIYQGTQVWVADPNIGADNAYHGVAAFYTFNGTTLTLECASSVDPVGGMCASMRAYDN